MLLHGSRDNREWGDVTPVLVQTISKENGCNREYSAVCFAVYKT